MNIKLDLDDAFSKLNHAAQIVFNVRSILGFSAGENVIVIPLHGSISKDGSCLEFRVGEFALPEEVPLLIGDAVQNYRACLDYLWWQYARRYLGRDPLGKEVGQVQYPCVYEDEGWGAKGNRRFSLVDCSQIEHLKKYQPLNDLESPHPLVFLEELSNIDKHRRLHMLSGTADHQYLRNDSGYVANVEIADIALGIPNDRVLMKVTFLGFESVPDGALEGIASPSFGIKLGVEGCDDIFAYFSELHDMCSAVLQDPGNY